MYVPTKLIQKSKVVKKGEQFTNILGKYFNTITHVQAFSSLKVEIRVNFNYLFNHVHRDSNSKPLIFVLIELWAFTSLTKKTETNNIVKNTEFTYI